MFKPSFTVVTCVLVVFAILAFIRYAFVRFIPPVYTNSLATSHEKFLVNAAHEEISWHVFSEGVFDEARLANKPVLLVIGTSSTKFGHEFDVRAFEEPDTARYVNQNFFCIRIDGYEHPEWLNAVLPLSRLGTKIVPAFQVWILDSNAQVISYIGKTYENGQLESRGIYKGLVDARRKFDVVTKKTGEANQVIDLQSADLNYLTTHPGVAWPSLSAYAEVLGTRSSPRFGGFPRGDTQELFPNAWRFLTLTGYNKLWHASLDPLLLSKLVDVQDGGFFRLGLTPDISHIEFDKGTRANAEMMLALSLQSQIEGDEFAKTLAVRTFDWLRLSAQINGLMGACQEDDENPQGRSPRFSFSNYRLREILQPADRDWASQNLGLNPMTNSQMVPFLKSKSVLTKDKVTLTRVLALMRASTNTDVVFNDKGYLDINGHSLARMLEVARLWNDSERLESIRPLVAKLSAFHDAKDLIHWAKDEESLLGYLGDYLALSDAKLQEYLATGQVAALEVGLRYLNMARAKFQGARPGELNLNSTVDQMGGVAEFCVPEIADNLAESCSAQAIRLELAYSRLTADTQMGEELLRSARQTTAIFADVASRAGPDTGGYFCAAAEILDNEYAISVGPNAQNLASDLYRRIPTRFCAPAVGRFRKDLQARKPGIYLLGKTVRGPYTVDEAAKRLPLLLVSNESLGEP